MISLIWMYLIFGHIAVEIIRDRLVKGSHGRYVFTTIRIVLSWTIICLSVINIGTFLAAENTFGVICNVVVLVVRLIDDMQERKKDEDNWFNGRWTKIKNGLKNYAQSLQRTPSLVTQ
jgi:large-conductance mechanosensitive channel